MKKLMMLAVAAFAMNAQAEYTDDCITFSGAESFTLKTSYGAKNWDGTLWTSADKTNWTEWNGEEVVAAQMGGTYNLYVRGNTSNTKIAYGTVWKLSGSADIACTGNIETLRGATGNDPSPTPMADDCYRYMFDGCTSLTVAPALPATTLSQYCYDGMFSGCTALTNAPALPATNLASGCYYKMFMDCTSLTKAPVLPATNLADYCYCGMFLGCTSLKINTAAPGKAWKIPATSTTATDWGTDMFYGTGGTLQGQPVLNATYFIKSAPAEPGSERNPWQIGAGAGDTVNAWTNGTGTLVVEGAGKMKAFASDGSDVPWPVAEISAVEIAKDVTSIGENAWRGLDDGVTYNGLSAAAAKTMGDGFGGTAEYGRVAFKEFQVDGGSVQATVALETAKSLTNEWSEVELTDDDVRVENGRIVITHETDPQAQGFYLMQPTK